MQVGAVAESGTYHSNYPVKFNETDQVADNILKQIQKLQNEIEQMSQNKEMPPKEKLDKKKELETQIANLRNQLAQREMDKRRQESEEQAERLQKQAEKNAPKEEAYQLQISTNALNKLSSAQTSMKQINTMEKVKTKLEGEALCATDSSDYDVKIERLDRAIKLKATKLVEKLNQPTAVEDKKEQEKVKEKEGIIEKSEGNIEKSEGITEKAENTSLSSKEKADSIKEIENSTKEIKGIQNSDNGNKSNKETLPDDYVAINILV